MVETTKSPKGGNIREKPEMQNISSFLTVFFSTRGKKSCTIVFMRGMKDNYLYSRKKRKPYFAIPSENLESHFHETLYRMSLGSVFVFAKIIICFSELISFSRNSRNLIFLIMGEPRRPSLLVDIYMPEILLRTGISPFYILKMFYCDIFAWQTVADGGVFKVYFNCHYSLQVYV